MGKLTKWIDRSVYSTYGDNWDDDLFREEILKILKPSDVVLDLGAGAGIIPQMSFSSYVAKVCGIDPDPRVINNPYLNEGRVAFGENIPYVNDSFDIVFADNVLEHLAKPKEVFDEISRVLKPGGVLLCKTPNKYHYMPLISKLTPVSFHKWYNKLRGRECEDTFPTCYLVNCKKDFSKVCADSNLRATSINLYEGRPEYLRVFFILYVLGALYQKIVSSTHYLDNFRILLIGIAKKPKLD